MKSLSITSTACTTILVGWTLVILFPFAPALAVIARASFWGFLSAMPFVPILVIPACLGIVVFRKVVPLMVSRVCYEKAVDN